MSIFENVIDRAPATADLTDRIGPIARVIQLPWVRFGQRQRFAGPAVTFRGESDTKLIRPILEEEGRGRVLVIDNGGAMDRSIYGDHFGALMETNSWAGTVINGVTRDAEGLSRLDVSVMALGVSPIRPLKDGKGERNPHITIAGVLIRPGDWVVGDADGVVVVPFEKLGEAGLLDL